LTLQSFIALTFGTGEGEGGTFALWTALFPRRIESDEDRQLTRYTTQDQSEKEDAREGDVAGAERMGYKALKASKWMLMVWVCAFRPALD
jgi:KUP system potassium uptake protein